MAPRCLTQLCVWLALLVSSRVVRGAYTATNWLATQELIAQYFPHITASERVSERVSEGVGRDYSSLRLLEFGSQRFDKVLGDEQYAPFAREGYLTSGNTAKFFFRHLGITHTSLDIHGWSSAIPLDCSSDLTAHFQGQPRFHVVTDLKFSHYVGEGVAPSEVVRAQYMLWRNMHELSAPGSLHVHELVEKSTGLIDAGVVHHSLEFVRTLAHLCGYTIEEDLTYSDTVSEESFLLPSGLRSVNRQASDVLTHTVFMRKPMVHKEFISYEVFESIRGLTVVDRRDTALVLLSLPDESLLVTSVNTSQVDVSTWAQLVCAHYYPTVVATTCVDFVESHVRVKLEPSSVRLSAHDSFYKYGVVEVFLMELSMWPHILMSV